MNRVKLWVFTLLVVAAAYVALRATSVSMRSAALAAIDARLASAAAHVSASTRGIAHDASAAAAMLAGDERLAAALRREAAPVPPPAPAAKGRRVAAAAPAPGVDREAQETALREAAREALANAEKSFGFSLPAGTVVAAGNREWLAGKGEASEAEGETVAFLRGAIAGQPRRGFVRSSGALWYGAATPAGDGAGVVLLVPLDDAWAKALAAGAAADVTLAVPEVRPVSTAPPADAPALQAVTKLAGAADVGRSGAVDASLGPVKLPKLPDPLGDGPALRARAIPLEGLKGGFAIASIAAAPAMHAIGALHYQILAGIAAVLLVGLVLGLFVRATEPTLQVPAALHSAASRIEKGDFSARAPQLAGKLGTVAAALNKAAEVAGPAQAALGPLAPGSGDEQFQAPARAEPLLDSNAFQVAPRPAPVAEPFPAAAPARTLAVAPAPAPAMAAISPAAAVSAAVAVAPPAVTVEVDEEAHWQQVFQDFLRTRTSCGEPTEALTYEKFRQKLDSNKGQLVAKYGCKTVRFQVYVKEGKAALKATPVK